MSNDSNEETTTATPMTPPSGNCPVQSYGTHEGWLLYFRARLVERARVYHEDLGGNWPSTWHDAVLREVDRAEQAEKAFAKMTAELGVAKGQCKRLRERAETAERLAAELADEQALHAKTADNFEPVAAGWAEERERLIRELHEFSTRARIWEASANGYHERAETAERERDEARRMVCERDAASSLEPIMNEPPPSHFAAERGWGYLYPEGSPTTGATKGETLNEHVERLIADLPHSRATTGGEQP